MSRSYWDKYRPLVIDLTRTIKKWVGVTNKSQPVYSTISLPIFSVSGVPWLGASIITTEFHVNLGVNVNLIPPIIPPVGINFCLAVRWPISGIILARYKLWQSLGEALTYPLYGGQVIPAGNFALEAWTIIGSGTTSLAAPYKIKTSITQQSLTSASESCCVCECTDQEDAPDTSLNEYCQIFAPWNVYTGYGYFGPFPAQFRYCLNSIY